MITFLIMIPDFIGYVLLSIEISGNEPALFYFVRP